MNANDSIDDIYCGFTCTECGANMERNPTMVMFWQCPECSTNWHICPDVNFFDDLRAAMKSAEGDTLLKLMKDTRNKFIRDMSVKGCDSNQICEALIAEHYGIEDITLMKYVLEEVR